MATTDRVPGALPALSSRYCTALIVIVVAGCLLRVGWVAAVTEPPTVGDPSSYFFYGKDIAAGNGYRYHAVVYGNIRRELEGERPLPVPPTAFFPVGYPAVLAGLFTGMDAVGLPDSDDARALAAMLLNVALGTAMIGLVFGIARRLLEPTAALIAAAFVAFEPNLIFHVGTLHLETLSMTLLLTALYVLVRRPWPRAGPSLGRCAGAGVLVGFGTLVRPTGLALVVLLPLALIATRVSWKRALGLGAVLACGAAVVIAPWTIRNLVVLGEPIAVSTGVADALCMGRHDGADGRFVPSPDCDEGFKKVPLADSELERYHTNIDRSVSWVTQNPLSEIRQWFNRMLWAHREDHDALEQVAPRLSSFQYATFSTIADGFYFVLLGLGLLGARAFARRREPRGLLLLLAAASLAVVPLLLFGDPRYKVPLVPVLAILAAPAALAAWRGARGIALAPPTE